MSTNQTVYLQLLFKSQNFATKLKLAVMTGEENKGPTDIDRNKTQEELILNLSEFLRKQYKYNMCLGLVQNTPQQ